MEKEIKKEIQILKDRYNKKKIKLNKEYWISGWAYDPLYEGYEEYKEVITKVKDINGYKVYFTNRNCRYYFSWDIHESKFEAEKISNLKNTYLYDWCEYGEENLINGL